MFQDDKFVMDLFKHMIDYPGQPLGELDISSLDKEYLLSLAEHMQGKWWFEIWNDKKC